MQPECYLPFFKHDLLFFAEIKAFSFSCYQLFLEIRSVPDVSVWKQLIDIQTQQTWTAGLMSRRLKHSSSSFDSHSFQPPLSVFRRQKNPFFTGWFSQKGKCVWRRRRRHGEQEQDVTLWTCGHESVRLRGWKTKTLSSPNANTAWWN